MHLAVQCGSPSWRRTTCVIVTLDWPPTPSVIARAPDEANEKFCEKWIACPTRA
jgi:hypothetical protein